MPNVLVVGAGPAGCAAALRAAKLPDVTVCLLEKRTFASLCGARNSARAYPMVLSGRGTGLLEELAIDLPGAQQPFAGISFLPSGSVMRMAGVRPPPPASPRPSLT